MLVFLDEYLAKILFLKKETLKTIKKGLKQQLQLLRMK